MMLIAVNFVYILTSMARRTLLLKSVELSITSTYGCPTHAYQEKKNTLAQIRPHLLFNCTVN